MRQFFVKEKKENLFFLNKEDTRHALKVLRLKISENIICVYESTKYLCKILEINQESFVCEIKNQIFETEKKYHLTIFFPWKKQKDWDLVVEKLTELGCDKIIPALFKRCQLNEKINFERLIKISQNAAKQSNRNNWIIFEKALDFSKMFETFQEYDLIFYGDQKSDDFNKSTILDNLENSKKLKIAAIIGPAGGFDESELSQLSNNANSVKLANYILRSETAAITITNYLYFLMESIN